MLNFGKKIKTSDTFNAWIQFALSYSTVAVVTSSICSDLAMVADAHGASIQNILFRAGGLNNISITGFYANAIGPSSNNGSGHALYIAIGY